MRSWGIQQAMGHQTALHIGASDLLWDDLRWFAIMAHPPSRNAMSPDELAALEEEEEHQRWLRSIDGDSMPGLFVALALGAAIAAGLYFLFAAITPA